MQESSIRASGGRGLGRLGATAIPHELARSINYLFISKLYTPVPLGGYERVAAQFALALREAGHSVVVLTSRLDSKRAHGSNESGIIRRLVLADDWQTGLATPGSLARTRVGLEWRNYRIVRETTRHLHPDVVVVWNGGKLGRYFLS